MPSKPDLLAEHARLTHERAILAARVATEWDVMSVELATARQQRADAIDKRLAAIEGTKTWLRNQPPVEWDGQLELPGCEP